MEEPTKLRRVVVRCSFCFTLNKVDMGKAAERPKCGKCKRPILLDRPVRISEEDFDQSVLQAEVPVLVDFYADWCGPCRMVAPLMDEIARENMGRLLVAKVDTDRSPSVSRTLGIQSIPTVILFSGGREVRRSIGFDPQAIRGMAKETS